MKSIKVLFVFFLTGFFFVMGCGDDKKNNPVDNNVDAERDGFKLVWSDEFNGSSIDRSKWIHEVNAWGGGNNELQYYTDRPENSFVRDGNLHIVGIQETYTDIEGTRDYTSARITTQQTESFQYGRVEARIKLPYGQGIWPAFWMLGININNVGWPACGEIDIMEMIGGGDGRDNVTHGTLHWEHNGHQYSGGSKRLASGNLADNFHVFAIEWDQNVIDWYFDDELFYTQPIFSQDKTEFHQPFFIILNLAIGGNWPGNPNASTVFPQEMLVDYVRVYEKDE
jgi:beta-glucanase (GH16 family)